MSKSARILIVGDEPAIANDLRARLAGLGYRVAGVARSGAEAVGQVAVERPDLVLMDTKLPEGMDSADAAAAEIRDRFDVPVLYLADKVGDATVQRARTAGAYGYILQPSESQFLETAIELALHKHAAEQGLRDSEKRLRLQTSALEATANTILIADCEGTIVWVNPAITRLTGYTAGEVVGHNPRLFKSGLHDAAFYEQMWDTILAGRVWHGEVVNKRRDGSYYTEEMTITPVRDSAAKISHFVAVKQDVTERRQAQEDLRRAKEAAEAANRAKSTFLANMSHELRTPLNTIIGYSEVLQEEAAELGNDDLVQDLERIRAAGRHLQSLILDVLDLSKIEAGRMALYLETFDVHSLLGEVVRAVSSLVDQQHNTLAVHCASDAGQMRADQAKVRQILVNLLSNAYKFTTQGQIVLAVEREAGEGGERLVFRVSDTGIGIAPDRVDRLFEPFTQADPSTTRKYGGTGLGLAISRRYCEMMGGTIAVQSRLGEGSTFTVRLPAQVEQVS